MGPAGKRPPFPRLSWSEAGVWTAIGWETSSIPAAKLEMATKLLLMVGILWPSLSENRELLGLRLGRNELFSLERQ